MDILIIYQHRVREYDNALLLKVALEKRGHRVEIKNDAAEMSLFRRYDLYLFPCLYNDSQFDFLTYRFNVYNRPVINLRYEQVATEYDMETGALVPQESAKKIPAINWGRTDFDYCKKYGMSEKLLTITGHIAMDFLRDEFSKFWYTKEEIASNFDLDSNKKWVLFISTLAYAEDRECLERGTRFFGESHELYEIAKAHTETRNKILEWVDKLLEKEDVCFIYRPHPSERTESDRIKTIIEHHKGKFFVIDRLNIKQWILVASVIMTWMSSSIAECYFAKKECFILRPEFIHIPEKWDALIYQNAKTISTYGQFLNSIQITLEREECSDLNNFPVSGDYIRTLYQISDEPVYEQIIKVIDKYSLDIRDIENKSTWNIKRVKYLLKHHMCLKICGKKLYQFMYQYLHFRISDENIRMKFAVESWERDVRDKNYNKKDTEKKLHLLRQIVE